MLYEFDHQQCRQFTIEESDESLMARLQVRDEGALDLLVRRHAPLMRTVASRVLNNASDVDDLINETFLEIWNRASSFDSSKGKPMGWIVTMTRRRALDKVRRRQAYDRAGERLRLATEQEAVATFHDESDEQAATNERAAMLQNLLKTLPEAQREAVYLAYYRGLTQREIASRLNAPLGTIKTRLELGMRKLRAALLSSGGQKEWSPRRR